MTCHNTYVIVQQCPECVMQIWEYICNNTLWSAVCAFGRVGVSHLHSGSIHFYLLSPRSTADTRKNDLMYAFHCMW